MLNDPFDPKNSLQLNNKHWPGDKFNHINLIADTEMSLNEFGYFRSRDLINRCAQLLPKLVRNKFRFIIAREGLFKTKFGLSFHEPLAEVALPTFKIDTTASCALYDRAQKSLKAYEEQLINKYRMHFGFDFIKLHRQIRVAIPDDKTKDIVRWGMLSDFHIDEAKGITTMIYLSDVMKPEEGAFQYIENSETIPRSRVLTSAHICVGFGLSITDPSEMGFLPLEFRGNPGIGNFLEVDKVDYLAPSIKTVLGKRGTNWSFNGHLLLHRGGKVLSGRRIAYFLQPEGKILFKARTAFRALLPSLI